MDVYVILRSGETLVFQNARYQETNEFFIVYRTAGMLAKIGQFRKEDVSGIFNGHKV